MNIILLGPPGAGKGTQAKQIETQFNIPQISTGDILRTVIKSGSKIGIRLQTILNTGDLVSDDFIIQIVQERLSNDDCKHGFMLDGVPRTLRQAQAFKRLNINIDLISEITLDDIHIIKRISGRRTHEASGRTYHVDNNPPKIAGKDDLTGEDLIQRNDDKEETVKKRLNIYHAQTTPLIEYYTHFSISGTKLKKPTYVKINGNQPVTTVTHEIFQVLHNYKKFS